MICVTFTLDATTATGTPPAVGNDEVLELAAEHPDVVIPFVSIDPHLGSAAVAELRRLVATGLVRGFKFHPSVQAFWPNDETFYPLYEAIAETGLPALFHTGHTGVGAGEPGGGGVRTKYANPMALDDVAVDFPELTIILAHPSFPWQDEAISVALHKPRGLHRPVGMVAEVLPAQSDPVCEHVASRQGPLRLRLPGDHPRPLDGRLREAAHQRRGAAADPEGERRPPPRALGGRRARTPVGRVFRPARAGLRRARGGGCWAPCDWTRSRGSATRTNPWPARRRSRRRRPDRPAARRSP